MGKTSTASKNKYNLKAYDQIPLRVPKGKKEALQAHVQERGESLNGFINRIVDEAVERDTNVQAPETPQDGILLLRELGYDPKAEKPLYVEKSTGKQYYVEPVPNDTQPDEYSENNVPF